MDSLADGSRQRGWIHKQMVPRNLVGFISIWFQAGWLNSLADGSRQRGCNQSQMIPDSLVEFVSR